LAGNLKVTLPPLTIFVAVTNVMRSVVLPVAVPTFWTSVAADAPAVATEETVALPPYAGRIPVVADAVSSAMPLLLVCTEKVPADCALLTDHADKTRVYEPGARLAVPTAQVMVCMTAAVHALAKLPRDNDTEEQVEVVLPPVSVAAVAVFKYNGVKLKTILPPVLGTAVAIVNESDKVPVTDVPGIMSPATLAVAVPLPLAVPPTVIAGTEPEAGVSMMAPPLVVVQAM